MRKEPIRDSELQHRHFGISLRQHFKNAVPRAAFNHTLFSGHKKIRAPCSVKNRLTVKRLREPHIDQPRTQLLHRVHEPPGHRAEREENDPLSLRDIIRESHRLNTLPDRDRLAVHRCHRSSGPLPAGVSDGGRCVEAIRGIQREPALVFV